jgi:phosphatidylglycerophosphate synthase
MTVASSTAPPGAKKRDYWWTVLAVDPLAGPLVRLLSRRRWPSPDQTTIVSLALGLVVGPAYATGARAGLMAGAALFYLSFLFDCIDGKLARALHTTSVRGEALERLADGARRASAVLGLGIYLWRVGTRTDLLWLITFGILTFYFTEISGAERGVPSTALSGWWSNMLARWRLLPHPGLPDVSALVFIFGPISGYIVPALVVGIGSISLAILITVRRLLRR